MPYAISLPTTSVTFYSGYFRSDSHPSLIWAATNHRNELRSALKRHKRLPISARPANLKSVQAALDEYLPYVFVLDSGLSRKSVDGEEIDVILEKEVEVGWRPSLVEMIAARESPKIKGFGLDYEICFVLTALAYTYNSLARAQLHTLFSSVLQSPEQRTAAITGATKLFIQANTIHRYVSSRSCEVEFPSSAVDVSGSVQNALGLLSLAEATLLAILKDDPYPAVVSQDRNKNDKEWMIKAPDIPKVRAHLFARLALAAAEHSARAYALLSASNVTKGKGVSISLLKYTKSLQRTSRAKACRFFGIDADLSGKTGEAIAWLNGAKKELGLKLNDDEGSKVKGLAKLKKDWTASREDKKVEKGVEWGMDAGKFEELRVIEMLETKWNKANNLINCQQIPQSDPLLSNMPSGRDIHILKPYLPPSLDADVLALLRAPLDHDQQGIVDDESDDSDNDVERSRANVPGAFPGEEATGEQSYY